MCKTLIILAFIGLVGSTACSNTKKIINIVPNKVTEIIWGSGGGFSGLYITYTLQKSGEIKCKHTSYNAALNKDLGMVKILRKTLTDSLFNEVLTTGIKTTSLNEPGNMTYFLKINESGKVFEATWSAKAPSDIEKFYGKLNDMMNPPHEK